MLQNFINSERSGACPVFSIVMPCYNSSATIEDTLASVRDQTFEDYELIIVDDGSTDGVAAVLERWAGQDSRLRVVARANGGPSRARNHGALDLARGRYIAFLDADDLWADDKLARIASALDSDLELAGVYGRVAFFRDHPDTARTFSQVLHQPLTPADLLRGNAVCTMSNMVVRTEAFRATGGFDPAIIFSEDLEWLVRLTAAGARVESIDETLTWYRSSDGGLSINVEAMHDGWRRAAASAERSGCVLAPSVLRAAEASHLRVMARRALRGSAPRFSALKLAVRGALRSPRGFFADPWRGLLTFVAAGVDPWLPAGFRRLALQF